MHDDNPAPEATPPWEAEEPAVPEPVMHPLDADAEATASGEATAADAAQAPSPSPEQPDLRRALAVWLFILIGLGVGGLLMGQQELAGLVAVSGVVIAAQAADLLPRWQVLYQAVSISLITVCTGVFVMLGARFGDEPSSGRTLQVASFLSAFALVFTAAPPVSSALSRAMFRDGSNNHLSRLVARLTLFGLLFAIPGSIATQQVLIDPGDLSSVFERMSLGGTLTGYVVLALAAVGFLLRRDLGASLVRLGLTRPAPRDLGIVALGVVTLFALNAGGDVVQHRLWPALWQADHRMNEAMASGLSRSGMLALGLTAGIGEEITMRGALQPRLGLVLTAMLFASFHVQYSWFGMAMVFLFGLALGVIRQRTSTTVAIGVHAAYDVLALLTT